MEKHSRLPGPLAYFDTESWDNGYTRGYVDGHAAGACAGEEVLRGRLLRYLERFSRDLRLGVLHDVETPLEALREVELRIKDRALCAA